MSDTAMTFHFPCNHHIQIPSGGWFRFPLDGSPAFCLICNWPCDSAQVEITYGEA